MYAGFSGFSGCGTLLQHRQFAFDGLAVLRKRIDVETIENPELKTSAYKNENGDLVIVFLNRSEVAKNIQLNLPNLPGSKVTMYETSESRSLAPLENVNPALPFSVPKQSISTLVIAQ